MNTLRKISFLVIGFVIATGCQSNSEEEKQSKKPATHHISSNSIEVSGAWVRPAAKGTNSAAYLEIYNGTIATDTLLAVKTDITNKAEVHESYEEDGLSGMRPAGRLTITPDSTLKLQPGGYHVMLMQLGRDLAEGDSVQIDLQFSTRGTKKITASVKQSR